eukprot:Gb_01196 [translate_table: standard]
MEPMQKYSGRAHDKNPAHTPESSDKVIEDTTLLVEAEKYQSEARPSGASPNLTCRSNILSNITYEPVGATRDSQRIPQGSTEESPQGTNHSYTCQTPVPTGRAKGDSLVFDISTNSIKKLTKRLLGSDPKRPQDESPTTFPTNSRSFEEILESVINNLPKVTLVEREGEPPRYIAEEETSIENIEETLDTFDSSEFQHKTNEPVSVRKNPLFKRKGKMALNGHPKSFRPPQLMGNMNQTGNNQELRHNNQGPQNNVQPNQCQANTQGGNTNGGTIGTTNYNAGSSGLSHQNQGIGSTRFQTCPTGQGLSNHQNMNVGSNCPNDNTWGSHNPNLGQNITMFSNGGNQSNFYRNSGPNHSSQMRIPNQNIRGQAYNGCNTNNVFQNTNSMGRANPIN